MKRKFDQLINSYRKSTPKQRAAVHFCEQWLNIEFEGDIDNFNSVSDFLADYLADAKEQAMELRCEYEAYLQELDD